VAAETGKPTTNRRFAGFGAMGFARAYGERERIVGE
jgi:hypothetical protein